MAMSPDSLPGPRLARSQPMSRRMPRMSPSSGANKGMLSKLERTTDGTALFASERNLRGPGRAHGVEEIEHAAVDEREQRFRIKAEDQHDDGKRHQRRDLTHVDLGEFAAESLEVMAMSPFLAELAEEHALHRPEVIGGGDDDAGGGEDGHHAVDRECAHEGEHLADEPRETGQPER